MRLLHAADLHLGKTLHERDLLADQAHMLEALLKAAAAEKPAAILVAGDLYDRSVPPPEALRLFDAFLNRVQALDRELAVVVIPGNHDSAARLSFGAGLLARAGLHLRTRPEDCAQPLVLTRGGERLALFALPFLNPGAFPPRAGGGEAGGAAAGRPGAAAVQPGSAASAGAAAGGSGGAARPERSDGGLGLFDEPPPPLRSQGELFGEAMRRIGGRLDEGAYNVLLAHCFAAGCSGSESERAFVGAAELVDAALLDPFDYAALGHLHRPQAAGAKGRYPGSPLAYAFSEGEEGGRGFLSVELGPGGFEARLLPVEPLRRLRRVEGPFERLAAPGAYPEFRGDFVEARLTDEFPVLDPADPLKANFPNLLSVRQAAFEIRPAGQGPEGSAEAPAGRGAEGGAGAALADFEAFHLEMRGSPPDAETAALFAELLAEAELAAR